MVGRSNVGKSSLINALVKQKIARTSAAPGKTRLVNYYLIGLQPSGSGLQASAPRTGAQLYLVDLPGYGYARGGEESVQAFETLTREYFDVPAGSPRHIAGVLHLIDARHPDLPHDAAAFEWLERSGAPIVVLATKIDKLKSSEIAKTLNVLRSRFRAQVLPTSSSSGAGLDDVRKLLRDRAGSPTSEARSPK